jgi:hypothetical protein
MRPVPPPLVVSLMMLSGKVNDALWKVIIKSTLPAGENMSVLSSGPMAVVQQALLRSLSPLQPFLPYRGRFLNTVAVRCTNAAG